MEKERERISNIEQGILNMKLKYRLNSLWSSLFLACPALRWFIIRYSIM